MCPHSMTNSGAYSNLQCQGLMPRWISTYLLEWLNYLPAPSHSVHIVIKIWPKTLSPFCPRFKVAEFHLVPGNDTIRHSRWLPQHKIAIVCQTRWRQGYCRWGGQINGVYELLLTSFCCFRGFLCLPCCLLSAWPSTVWMASDQSAYTPILSQGLRCYLPLSETHHLHLGHW